MGIRRSHRLEVLQEILLSLARLSGRCRTLGQVRSNNELPIAHGLCHCGCGEATKPAPKTSRRNGWVKGEPMRFVDGHSARLRRINPELVGFSPPNPSGRCMCGCGRATRIAPRSNLQLGWLKGEPIRFIHGHHARRSVSFETDVDYRNVDLGHLTPCWIWLRARCGNYGCVWRHRDGRRTPTFAHRLSYEHHIGPIGDGLTIDHLCEIKLCVNPDHLEPVSSGENTRRAARRKSVRRKPRKPHRSKGGTRPSYAEDEPPYEVVHAGHDSPCWLWLRAVSHNGYPVRILTRKLRTSRRSVYAHRVCWARVHGPIPEGHEIDHLCGNISCVNPDHLESVPADVHRTRTVERRRRHPLTAVPAHPSGRGQ